MRLATQAVTAAAAVGVAVAASSAFTASNAGTPVVSLGQKSEVTSGYTVSHVDYALSSGAAGAAISITNVVFRVVPTNSGAEAATDVKVRLVSTGSYLDCTFSTDGTLGASPPANAKDVTCPAAVLASAADTLDIVATSR